MLGITSIVFSWMGLFALAQIVLAVTFGAIGMHRAKNENSPKGLATAGFVLGLVGLVVYFFIGLFSFGMGWIV